jgi:putative spermidine/putrescine transport system ATP-binding protein
MDTGRIDQEGSASIIFDRPKTPYVARFMGGQNVLTGTVVRTHGPLRLRGPHGAQFEASTNEVELPEGSPVSFAVRRDHVKLRKSAGGKAPTTPNEVQGVVEATEYQGSYIKVFIDLGSGAFVAHMADRDFFASPVEKGDTVVASWSAADINILRSVDRGEAGDPYSDATH